MSKCQIHVLEYEFLITDAHDVAPFIPAQPTYVLNISQEHTQKIYSPSGKFAERAKKLINL